MTALQYSVARVYAELLKTSQQRSLDIREKRILDRLAADVTRYETSENQTSDQPLPTLPPTTGLLSGDRS